MSHLIYSNNTGCDVNCLPSLHTYPFCAANGTPKSQTTAPEASTFKEASNDNIAAQTFTFRELSSATKNFRPESLLGEGGFGRVHKGRLDKPGQVISTDSYCLAVEDEIIQIVYDDRLWL